ncbi:MAG: hypothetical protein IK139_01545 [Lachnospiraceae bacterium]|nr:hypothetical protein [Lachnospiraceae bacterium]
MRLHGRTELKRNLHEYVLMLFRWRHHIIDKSRSRETDGTGLGLAIVKHIAEIHNAKISVESEPDQGTCIIVKFMQ